MDHEQIKDGWDYFCEIVAAVPGVSQIFTDDFADGDAVEENIGGGVTEGYCLESAGGRGMTVCAGAEKGYCQASGGCGGVSTR